MNHETESTARALVADGKGILAADETPGTLTRRFDALGVQSTGSTGEACECVSVVGAGFKPAPAEHPPCTTNQGGHHDQ